MWPTAVFFYYLQIVITQTIFERQGSEIVAMYRTEAGVLIPKM